MLTSKKTKSPLTRWSGCPVRWACPSPSSLATTAPRPASSASTSPPWLASSDSTKKGGPKGPPFCDEYLQRVAPECSHQRQQYYRAQDGRQQARQVESRGRPRS